MLGALMRLGSWQQLRPGVKKLHLGSDGDQEELALLWYAPGAEVPSHLHTGRETIFMLDGVQADESDSYGPGALRINEAGTSHSIRSERGCLLLIHWQRPVQFL
jgi:anti-sigma factor ChrR (cupin superfamily)